MADDFLCSTTVECPPSLLNKAAPLARTVTAVVNAGSPVVMRSVKMAVDEELITPVLIGNKSDICLAAKEIDWDISELRLLEANDEQSSAATAVSLARNHEVASLMKGNIHTDQLLKAVLDKQAGLRTNARLSHVFHMSVANSNASLCITDAVINVLPSVSTKLDIARNATKLMHSIGYQKPKIAILSATEVVTEAMPSSIDASEIVAAADAGEVEGAIIGGPFAFDNAVSPAAAKLKKISHPVAGNADVLLVPNIETGNALFKQMV